MSNIFDQARNIVNSLSSKAYSLIPSSTTKFDYRTPPPLASSKMIGDPSQMKMTVSSKSLTPGVAQPTAVPQQQPQPTTQVQSNWQSKYQPLYDKALPQKRLSKNDVQVLVTSENGREDPGFQNFNYDKATGKAKSVDTGLLQINTPIDSPEISQLKDPEYNINKGLEILRRRNDVLGDPVLAIASYNKGAGGAVLDPKDALRRAQIVYKNAGVPLPDTPFTRDPEGFVNQNMDKYRQLGLFK